jgi:hypothetical protein
MNITKLLIPLIMDFTMLIALPAMGNAASCAAKANQVAAKNGGELLSISTVGSGASAKCKITILVKSSSGGPARKKTIIVRK